ncbi:MAG: DNA methyltransferase [Verrucomicrobia bacterium]|nr:MAG: DNA methyltransferase [Verrucomicrobiota bacterium]
MRVRWTGSNLVTKPRKFEKVDEAETREGQIKDFISGQWVKVSPEEVDAVQIFSRRLVEDFDYPKSHVQTRPQFRVRKRPSDQEKSYPVDIAVFRSSNRIEDELFLIVECKKKNRKDGLAQLKLYLDMSPADVGVWFNGQEHAYLRKIHHKDGRRTYEELPNIPRHGQRIEDIGQFQRKDLKIPSDLKAVFRDLRNHLAGNVTGITRDEALAQQIINILFCKIYDEINTGSNEVVTFRTGIDEPARDVKKRILALFDDSVKAEFDDVFDKTDAITIDADSLVYVVGELQNYCITEASRDAVGDAFEVFIGPALRGGEGQFFTPRNVVRMMIEILDPKPSDMILDPACGSGGFLIMALEYVWKKIEGQAKKKGWSNGQLDHKKREIASKCFRGIDKDSFLAKVTKAYMAIIGDGRGGVFCENSLVPTIDWHHSTQDKKIEKTDSLHDDQPPQILFLERCLQFLNPGGRLGIVLPEAVFGMPTYEYVVAFLRERTRILGIVSMPEALFKTSGKGGTHAKVCVVFIQNSRPKEAEDYAIFMADAKWCGHDSRGNPTIRLDAQGNELLLDDIPTIADKYKLLSSDPQGAAIDHLGFFLSNSSINKNIFIPKYYDPEIKKHLSKLAKTHQLVALGEFVDQGVLQADTGIEVGKMAYGTGPVPFIRTSDISNWELKADPKQNVSAELYEQFKEVQDVQAEDIFVVRDGTYLVGVSCILTEHDTRILYCGGIYKIRVLRKDKLDPYLLLALLNCPIVKRQMRSKQFTRDVIDTLGKRIYEVVLPIPKAGTLREQIAKETRETVIARVELRNRAQQIALEVEGITDSEDAETIDDI